MGRSTIPPALAELSNPSSAEAQLDALRNLKNEIVGHEQRKELAVVHGVVKPLARLLRAETRKGGKRRRGIANGHGSASASASACASGSGLGESVVEWSTEDELRFQATLVVGSLANGGPAFITPLLSGGILPPLFEALSPSETPAKLVLNTLRTLNQIVNAVSQEKPAWELSLTLTYTVKERIYTKPVIDSLAEILAQNPRSRIIFQQISATAHLITKTCHEEGQRKMLLDAGILDLLTAKLAAVAAGDDPSGASEDLHEKEYALPVTYLPDVLEAVSTIVKDSHYNTARFLYSQPIQNLFSWPKGRTSVYDSNSGSGQAAAWDKLIPRLQTLQSKSDPYAKSWPALGSYSGTTPESFNRLPSMESIQQHAPNRSTVTDESETPLFTWLIHVARRGEGRERLSACWLLALLKKFGEKWSLNDPSKSTRERHFSYLIVPLVVKMVEEASPLSDHASKMGAATPLEKEERRFVLERSPLVLAELVAGNKTLQNAAVDARILPLLVQILKKSFEPVTNSTKPLWQPKSSAPAVKDPMVDAASSTLGAAGVSADVLHALKYRESALLALAAIGDSQDTLRKHIIEMGAGPYLVDSLVPYHTGTGGADPESPLNLSSTSGKDGNPEGVLIAACKVIRSLSRSVSVLRTSLIDNGVAKPCFDLLTHPSVKVQIAATEVITNLVLEVSPMRNEIIEAGAFKTLCEHCRSANFDLRYGSLWALKHLCLGLSLNLRVSCLDELGVGWLVQVLKGEPTKSSSSAPLAMGTPNAAGEQVDLLNAVDDAHMDVDDVASSSEDEDTMTDSIPSLPRHQRPSSRYTSATNIRDRLQQIKTDEQDTRLSSERDDFRIQEQALDFIRNFITTPHSEDVAPMIDRLLKSIGHTTLFELLDAKLRPKASLATGPSTTSQAQPTSSSTAPSYWPNLASHAQRLIPFSPPAQYQLQNPNWSLYPPVDLMKATLYILTHLANGLPTHRSLLISQTLLMSHVLPLLSHPRREIRLACAWLLNNLIYVQDQSDEAAARDRAMQLRNLGFEDGAKQLVRDMDLDIRERGKTAVEQMSKLLGTAGASAPGSGYASPQPAGSGGGSAFGGDGGASGLSGMRGLGGLHPGRPGTWGRGHD